MKKLVAVAAVVLVLLAGSTAWAACGCAPVVVPAPVVSYMPVAPVAVAAYYPPPLVVYRPLLVAPRPVVVAPAPVVVARPVIVRPRFLVPGQPVRNVLRVTWP